MLAHELFLRESGSTADIFRARSLNSFYLVTNAGRADVDIPWITKHVEAWNAENSDKVEFKILDSAALVALQGAPVQVRFA